MALAETAGAAEDQRRKKALTQSNSHSKRPAFLWAHGLSKMPAFFYRSGPAVSSAGPQLLQRCLSVMSRLGDRRPRDYLNVRIAIAAKQDS